MTKVRLFVEGGGDSAALHAACRQGFARLLERALDGRRRPQVIACGSRNAAFDRFVGAARQFPDDISLLLVDSEDQIASNASVTPHLHARDGWSFPAGSEPAHLMVRTMEAWLCCDPVALSAYFGPGFLPDKLPSNPRIEDVAKTDLYSKLESATRGSRKGAYGKGAHSFEALAAIDFELVCARSPHAASFRDRLVEVCPPR